MEESEKRQIGEEVEPGGRPKAPGRLEMLQRFVNTYNHDFPEDWDRIGTGAKASAWLERTVTDAEAARLREFREALRALIAGRDAGAWSATLRVTLQDGRTALVADSVLATLLSIVHEAQLSG